jgi:hypothetical protein
MDLAVSKEFKVNFNDARISRVYVTPTGVDVQDDSPNAITGNIATDFDLHLEMEQGGGVAGGYQLFTIAYDVTTGANEPALDPPPGFLNGPGTFAVDPPWTSTPPDHFFEQKETITIPNTVPNHIFYYTVALVNDNQQIVDIATSDRFILVELL